MTNRIDISIDMLTVGNANAVVVWLKDNSGSFIIVIDGGDSTDGEKLIAHMETFIFPYTIQKAPDLLILTHPDKDHARGLLEIVSHYKNNIKQIWTHDPAVHMLSSTYTELKHRLLRESSTSAHKILMENLSDLESLLTLCDQYAITRIEPFHPLNINGIINVLGPTVEYYESLLPTFESMQNYLTKRAALYSSRRRDLALDMLEQILTDYSSPTECPIVDQDNETTTTNESCAIIEIISHHKRFIFTGDAGVEGLLKAHAKCNLTSIHWLAVPHHGSRRNMCSELIKIMSPQFAQISAKGTKKHPRPALINCLKKYNVLTYSTHKSGNLWYHQGAFPERASYTTAIPL